METHYIYQNLKVHIYYIVYGFVREELSVPSLYKNSSSLTTKKLKSDLKFSGFLFFKGFSSYNKY